MATREYSEDTSSRPNSTDSEEVAAANGKRMMEEFAAKLNDVDAGVIKTGVRSGKGLISVDRFPFLSNLFNPQTSNNGIVVDEEDASQEDNPIADIFLWRFPLISAIWFIIVQLMFFLVVFCDFSLLTMAAFLALWQLVIDFSMAQFVPKAQQMGWIAGSFDIKEVIRKNTLFNINLNKRVASVTHEISDMAIGMWKVTVFEANLSSILVAGRFVVVVFLRSFSVATTIWLFVLVLFTIPISYSKNRIFADVVADGAHNAAAKRAKTFRGYFRQLVKITAAKVELESKNVQKATPDTKVLRIMIASSWSILLLIATRLDWVVEKIAG